ncbi:MAG: hypothetical protein H7329_05225 [Opitutaceae bacterium]|nr:hypothetical protein [Cytophagales bacterium]
MKAKFLFLLCFSTSILNAQQLNQAVQFFRPDMQYFRPNDQTGINVFETSKTDTTQYTGMKVRIGGNFTQDFQGLSHRNNADFVSSPASPKANNNQLIGITNGFNLAMANLTVDAQLADGIRVNVTMYLSSRHHREAWVKNGYVQIDRIPFFKGWLIDSLMRNFTARVGALEVNYGDQHFRRTDGGNATYNPFIENLIMDEFATEIGGELYYQSKKGFLAMGGITNGQLNPTVVAPTKIDSLTGVENNYTPAFYGKLGYDKQLTRDFRFRITGSGYTIKSTASNTLFAGDRTGSHYFYVIENNAATADANAFSGRYNPMFSQQVNTFMANTLLKYKGIELFGTYEIAQGRTITEKKMRQATQYAIDLVYRFPTGMENFWIAGRYNSVTATTPNNPVDITINRVACSVGCFMTKNLMVKAEYVNQKYFDFKRSDIRSEAKFDGLMLEAVVGF